MENTNLTPEQVVEKIRDYVKNYDKYQPLVIRQRHKLKQDYFSAKGLLENLG